MKRKNNTHKLVRILTESSIMIAIATVLSILKLVDMPYGGSVTFASMLPVMLISYRHGLKWGFGAGFTYAVLQLILGLDNFGYVTGFVSYIAVALFDYLIAFLAIGVGGIFRGKFSERGIAINLASAIELSLGAGIVTAIRYICHVIGGATVWAGLPIPSAASLGYSIGYNATYMGPELIINTVAAFFIGYTVNLYRREPRPYTPSELEDFGKPKKTVLTTFILYALAILVASGALIADTCLVFAHIQDPESGAFTLAYMSNVNWTAFAVVGITCFLLASVLAVVGLAISLSAKRKYILHKAKEQ